MNPFAPTAFCARFQSVLDRFEPLDIYTARFLTNQAPSSRELFYAAVLILNNESTHGHLCIPLDELHRKMEALPLHCPDRQQMVDTLAAHPLVATDGSAPLVLDNNRFYLRRLWQEECRCAEELIARAEYHFDRIADTMVRTAIEQATAKLSHKDLFARALCTAILRGLCVITGGPGSGKTTAIHALYTGLQSIGGPDFRIALCAPTGKAANRMTASLVRNGLSVEAQTIHRLLGGNLYAGTQRFSSTRPLPVDAVIVDELSMVDITMMNALLATLPPHARLVCLGDHHQLSSIHNGSILADLCVDTSRRPHSPQWHRRLTTLLPVPPVEVKIDPKSSPVGECIVELTTSFRFSGSLQRAATAVREGDGEQFVTLCDESPEITLVEPSEKRTIFDSVFPHLAGWFDATPTDPRQACDALENFRILCARRHGPGGTREFNDTIRTHLLRQSETACFPILITENDYAIERFNGDTGIVLCRSGEPVQAWFPDRPHPWSMARLPGWEYAFAVTIHKSQGSEYDAVCIVLPPEGGPMVSRELLYTALTRAKSNVVLVAPRSLLTTRAMHRAPRYSGLADRLYR